MRPRVERELPRAGRRPAQQGLVGLAVALLGLACARDLPAAEYTYANSYFGTPYTNTVYFDDSLAPGQIQGVIVTFNYGATVYNNAAWRNFARDRALALLLMLNQDTLGTPANVTDGLTILANTLSSVATASGHAELGASTLPLVFLGVSRGGTSGAINFGWAAGANRTVACIAYHGNSFNYLTSPTPAAATNIPVLYPMAQNDSGPYRQTDIETAVRTTNTTTLNGSIPATSFGYRPRWGLFWTTTMQYGSSHASTGDDTYPLQWLGRVWDARYNPATPGTLKAITNTESRAAGYLLLNGASSSAYFGNCTVTNFTQKDTNVWITAAGASEWLAESTQPQTGVAQNMDSTAGTIYTAPDTLLNRRFINSGSIVFTGSGMIGLDPGGSGNPVLLNMAGGTLVLQHGVTLRNGSGQGGVWTNNLAALSIDATSTFDLWNGNPVYIDALTGGGTVTISLNPGPNWAGARSLTVGVNNGSGMFSGLLAGNPAVDGGSISLTKVGTGTQHLNGTCRYSGATSVQAGTLVLGGTNTATASVEVSSNATFRIEGGSLSTARLHISTGGTLSGYGIVNGPLVNDGMVLVTNGSLSLTGTVTNNGVMRLTGGAQLNAPGPVFVNQGLLDLMTGAQTLPTNLINHGVVLDASQVQVQQAVVNGNDFQVTIQSYPGHNYQLLRADNPEPGSIWSRVGPEQAGTGSVLTFTDAGAAPNLQGFYRILVGP